MNIVPEMRVMSFSGSFLPRTTPTTMARPSAIIMPTVEPIHTPQNDWIGVSVDASSPSPARKWPMAEGAQDGGGVGGDGHRHDLRLVAKLGHEERDAHGHDRTEPGTLGGFVGVGVVIAAQRPDTEAHEQQAAEDAQPERGDEVAHELAGKRREQVDRKRGDEDAHDHLPGLELAG